MAIFPVPQGPTCPGSSSELTSVYSAVTPLYSLPCCANPGAHPNSIPLPWALNSAMAQSTSKCAGAPAKYDLLDVFSIHLAKAKYSRSDILQFTHWATESWRWNYLSEVRTWPHSSVGTEASAEPSCLQAGQFHLVSHRRTPLPRDKRHLRSHQCPAAGDTSMQMVLLCPGPRWLTLFSLENSSYPFPPSLLVLAARLWEGLLDNRSLPF